MTGISGAIANSTRGGKSSIVKSLQQVKDNAIAAAKIKQASAETIYGKPLVEQYTTAIRGAIQPQAQSAPASGPRAGEVVDGYRFKGGNPSDPNAWEKVK